MNAKLPGRVTEVNGICLEDCMPLAPSGPVPAVRTTYLDCLQALSYSVPPPGAEWGYLYSGILFNHEKEVNPAF